MLGPQFNLKTKFQRTAVFISGSGSTLQALLEQQHEVNLALVVSSKPNVQGLLRAQRFGIPTRTVAGKIDWVRLQNEMLLNRIERIMLCGFMKIVPATFLSFWKGRIFNIHPSLLPLHKGLEAAEKSYAAQDPMGVSVHEVIEGVDEGPLRLQAKSVPTQNLTLNQSMIFIRSREQMILRELSTGWML